MLDLNGLKARIAAHKDAGSTVIVTVLHSDKINIDPHAPVGIQANPPMTESGMVKIDRLVPTLRELSPRYDTMYSSRLSRANDTASILALEFDLDWCTMKNLGQHANKNGDEVVYYPGCEAESFTTWQTNCVLAVKKIGWLEGPGKTVLVAAHRPTILGLVAACRGLVEPDEIKSVVNNPEAAAAGYHVFAVTTSGTVEHLGP